MPAYKAPPSTSPAWKVVNLLSAANVALMRTTKGRLGSRFRGAPVLVLHHVGRKSGEHREAPLLYLADGDRYVIVASKGGTDKHPAWFHNLLATPEVDIEVKGRRVPVRARVVDDAERAELWPRLVAMYRSYETYQRATDRRIPVLSLDPR